MKCSSCRKSFKRRHHYNPSYIAWTCSGRIKEKEKCTIKY
ncbi:hypothetical protein IR145_16620, partial [Streptococcus danieliae]|nr:hypothetical protein [Streptococcus danieliae]